MKIRNAIAEDLSAVVEIYNSTVPTRASTADTEPVSAAARSGWFRERDPARRPLWVMKDGDEVVGWLSLGDFYDSRPAYHATAEIGVYVREDHRSRGVGRSHLDGAERDLIIMDLKLS